MKICKLKKSIAADPPPYQSGKTVFFLHFTNILTAGVFFHFLHTFKIFSLKIVFKIVQDTSRNIKDQ